jgi:hypothetical protein
MIMKPKLNIPLVADAVQFFHDFAEGPVANLLESVWDSDLQSGFPLRELALGAAIEGIATYVTSDYAEYLPSAAGRTTVEAQAIMNITRRKFVKHMQQRGAEVSGLQC